ncbi:hypothetical protein JXL83_04430 [candidate division WOR-3 bacterium]|nr:hypothetical protein [candidate division WOR-3 bacterium]
MNLFSLDKACDEILERHYSVSIQNGVYSNDSLKLSYRNIFDSNGDKVEDIKYDNFFSSTGRLIKKYIHYYDEEERKIRREIFNSDILTMSVEYSYTTIGEDRILVEERFYNPDGGLVETVSYEFAYGINGKWISKIIFIDSERLKLLRENIFKFLFCNQY